MTCLQYCALLACALVLGLNRTATAQPATTQPATTQPAAAIATTQPAVTWPSAPAAELSTLSLEDLMNVSVTSVSKTTERIADAPAAVTVITPDDIQRSGLHEIPDILRLSPGIFVQRGNQLTGWSVASRGFAQLFSNKLEVLEDGRLLYTPFFSGVYWDMVDYPILDLDRIEVIRGPGATLWGSNAVNGVINITSKSAQDTQGFMVDSRVGTDTSDLALRYGGKLDDDTYYRVWGKGRVFANDPDADDNSDDSRGGFRIDRIPDNQNTLTLQSDTAYQSISNDHVPGNPNAFPDYGHDYHSNANVLGRWSHVDSPTNNFSLQVYYDRTQQRDVFVTYALNTVDLDFQDHIQLDKHNELVWGFGARDQTDDIGTIFLPAPLVAPDARETDQFSGFIQDTVTLIPDQWKVVLGSKFEHNTFSHFDEQPSGRLIWTPNTDQTVWAAVSRAVRVPARWEEDSDFLEPIPAATPTFVEVLGGKSAVKPEVLIAYELGYRQQFGKDISIDATGYINDYDKLITVRPMAPVAAGGGVTILPEEWANGQTAQDYGAEFAANWQVTSGLRLATSYSYFESFVQDGPGIAADQENVVQRSYPTSQFQFHSYLDITKNLQFNASVYYASSIGASGVPVATGMGPGNPAYSRADFNLIWSPKPGLDLSVGVQNAFDPQHLEATTGEGSTAEVRRAVYTQLTWKF